jgi:hypothetical protein
MPANRQGNGNFFNYSALTDSQSQRTAAAQNDAPLRTIEQTQSTPPNPVSNPNPNPLNITNDDDGNPWAPESSGVGAGTGSNSANARGNDNTPPNSSSATQQTINQNFAGQQIVPQPNVLDQYASYTYAISWWVLTPDQYNKLSSGSAPEFGTGNWSLLVQSGGAPILGRNQYFPDDYYIDDLEIETTLMGKGSGGGNNAQDIKFKIVEPNGITLLQNLYSAVVAAYKGTNQAGKIPNYGAAQYCLTIEFYGYDSNGNLVAPATGQFTNSGQLAGNNPQAVIKKYYPFVIQNITFRTVANQVEYNVVGKPVNYSTGIAQARGTIPFAFALSGQTASQILQGSSVGATATTNDPGARSSSPGPQTSAFVPQVDSAQTAALFNDGTGYTPGYDPNAGWSA